MSAVVVVANCWANSDMKRLDLTIKTLISLVSAALLVLTLRIAA